MPCSGGPLEWPPQDYMFHHKLHSDLKKKTWFKRFCFISLTFFFPCPEWTIPSSLCVLGTQTALQQWSTHWRQSVLDPAAAVVSGWCSTRQLGQSLHMAPTWLGRTIILIFSLRQKAMLAGPCAEHPQQNSFYWYFTEAVVHKYVKGLVIQALLCLKLLLKPRVEGWVHSSASIDKALQDKDTLNLSFYCSQILAKNTMCA